MGIMVYSLLWVMQDFVHEPYHGEDVSMRNRHTELCLSALRAPSMNFGGGLRLGLKQIKKPWVCTRVLYMK